MCAYLTQMLKLSYALQYHRELRRIDGPTRKRSPVLRLCVCTRVLLVLSYVRCNLFRETATARSAEANEKESMEERRKRKLSLNSNFKIATIPYNARYGYDTLMMGEMGVICRIVVPHDTITYVDSNPSTLHFGI